MTPEELFQAEWFEIHPSDASGPNPEELFVWTPSDDDPYKRTLSFIRIPSTDGIFVIVYDQDMNPTQAWEIHR